MSSSVKSYFNYLLHRKSRYDIHSPLIFQFINTVLRSKKGPDSSARNTLLKNKSILKKVELGAGSKHRKQSLTIAQSTKISAINKKFSKLLFNISKSFTPSNILEFGTHFGIGTLAMHEGNPKAKITSIEGCPNTFAIAQRTIAQFANDDHQINLINTSFDDFLEHDHPSDPYELVYIDGNHQKEATLKYFEFALENASDFCIIILDDINWSQEMQEAWQIIIDQKKYYTVDLFRMGVVFVNDPIKAQHFILKY